MMDLAAPGLALGIVIGRIGDLIIGDHLGKPTAFPLGWRCAGAVGQGPPLPASEYLDALHQGTPPSPGCYGLTLHETALYDFISTIALLCVLVTAGRVARNRGLLFLIFVLWYGTMRVVTDFLRVDRRYLGLTGSQVTSLIVVAGSLYLIARYRGAPPRWAEPPGAVTTESDRAPG